MSHPEDNDSLLFIHVYLGVGDMFTCPEDESFEEGATKYLDDSDPSRDLELGEPDDEPDRAVLLTHGPTNVHAPEIIITSPDKIKANLVLDKNLGSAPMGKKKLPQQAKKKVNTTKNEKNAMKNTKKNVGKSQDVAGYKLLVDSSQSDAELSLEFGPDSVMLQPGPAQEESSTDCISDEPCRCSNSLLSVLLSLYISWKFPTLEAGELRQDASS